MSAVTYERYRRAVQPTPRVAAETSRSHGAAPPPRAALSAVQPNVFLLGVTAHDDYSIQARVRATNISGRTRRHDLRLFVTRAGLPEIDRSRVLAGRAALSVEPHVSSTTDITLDLDAFAEWNAGQLRWEPQAGIYWVQLEVDRPPFAYEALIAIGRDWSN